jgi:hypothetical protein
MMKKAVQRLEEKLRQTGKGHLRPASATDLKRAQDFGFPDELIAFYREHEPDPKFKRVELKQRIWCIEEALVENQNAVPGCVLSPQGYVVFASNMFGDAYCVDTNTTTPNGHHPVVLFSHEVIGEDSTPAQIQELRLEVASSFDEFLEKFTEGTLINKPKVG